MKKVISVLLALALAFSMVACGGTEGTAATETGKPELVYPFGVVNRPMDIGGGYPHKTVCYQDNSMETNGYVYISKYSVTPVEGEEGMVDKALTAGFIYNDYNAYSWGSMSNIIFADINGDGLIGGEDSWTVELDGKEYTVTVMEDQFWGSQWLANHVFVTFYNLTLRVPEGYDDMALFFYNTGNGLEISDVSGVLPDGANAADVLDSDTQWFILGGEDCTYNGRAFEKQQPRIDPADIVYDGLFEQEAPPPPPGDPVYELIPQKTEGTDTPAGRDNPTEDLPAVPDDYTEVPDTSDGEFTDNTDAWIELTDWTVNEIDGNGGYQPVNFFLLTHNWNPTLQTRYRSFTDTDGVLQEFTFEAMEDGSVSMDITGTDITAESVCFEFTLLDEDGFELSMTKVDIPVTR